jgi:hypothetical protein
MCFYWALYSVTLSYMLHSIPVPCCLDYYSFVVYFEVRFYDTSSFFLFNWKLLGWLGFLWFYMKFRIFLYFRKEEIRILMDIILIYRLLWVVWTLNRILLTHKQGIYLHLFIFNFFHHCFVVLSLEIFHLVNKIISKYFMTYRYCTWDYFHDFFRLVVNF